MNIERSQKIFRSKNKNNDFTLIARDCIGGILYHQLGLKFLSPTINLFLTPRDFNLLCLHLKTYMRGNLEEYHDESTSYPVGLLYPYKNITLPPIRIDFMHYDSYSEALQKWNIRKKRINYHNIYVISSFCYIGETKTLSEDIVRDWNKIKYKKMVFVNKKYGFDNECLLRKPKQCEEYAWLLYENDEKRKWKRVFNRFDFIKFLND